MPEELPPPKTIEEMGIHFVYLRKAQNDTASANRIFAIPAGIS